MPDLIDSALAALSGYRLSEAGREGVALWFRFRPVAQAKQSAASELPASVTLLVSCPWRLTTEDGLLVGSGDLFTPADPAADPETFDWQVPGATWCDLRLQALVDAVAARPPVLTTAAADAIGGLVLELEGGLILDIFPDSSPARHVESEYWRLSIPGEPLLVVGSNGVERVAQA